ncbi:MAG TPA: protease, partial [Acidobacteria bacterium]|nr:protease [Acidobacteriota bacterium]
PVFSPDGTMIAYTGDYDGNADVYVVPAAGGEPRRLTYFPGDDVALGWTPDGTRVVFRSSRKSFADSEQAFTVPVTGGWPTEVPLPRVQEAAYSPDGSRVAYQPNMQWEPAWKGYRGGQTARIWIADLSDSSIVKVPQAERSNDRDPMWVGHTVYFLSDRKGPVTLFAYDVPTGKVRQLIPNDGLDIHWASAGPGAIVYEQFGALRLYDLATGAVRDVPVRLAADMPQLRPHFETLDPKKDIVHAGISPTGKRAVFEAHGEIFTVPAEKGDIRDITRTTGAAERDPAWSPDGQWIAYFSDEPGEYTLFIRKQNGLGPIRRIDLGQPPSFFYRPVWSPDSTKIAYSDKRLQLWVVDLADPKPVLVDHDRFDSPLHEFDVQWSPDSRWLTYTKQLPSQLHAVYVYELATHTATQVTDGMSDALYPVFDRSGKYLFFTASTDVGLSAGWLDMSSMGRPVTRSVYAAVLRKDLPSPIPPESDEEKVAKDDEAPESGAPAKTKAAKKNQAKTGAKPANKNEKPPVVTIDFAGIDQRIVALPIPARNYDGLSAGKAGVLFLTAGPTVPPLDGPSKEDVFRFTLKKRKAKPLLKGVSDFALASDGTKMLYEQNGGWFIATSKAAPKGGDGRLDLHGFRVWVEPRAEWRQMYHEVWRIERDFFYDPHFHGLNLQAAEKAYAPYLDRITSRQDLNALFREMTGNMTVGHMFVRGGTMPKVDKVPVGLLGADYSIDHGRYRFARILNGENWNPGLHAPLTQPGIDVRAGEYLLAVNGRQLHATDNLYSFFTGTAGKQTVITVGPDPNGTGSRDLTVVPVRSERRLRHLAWVEHNRRLVDRLSGGRVAYVYLPDTANGGYTSFNRYFFAQVGKEAAILDERYNHGGQLADYIIDYLKRQPMSRIATRKGEDVTEPVEAIYGPKVMIINQFAGSGGDAM